MAAKAARRRRKTRTSQPGKTKPKTRAVRRTRKRANPRANHHMAGAVKMSNTVKSLVYNNAFSAKPSRSYQHKFGPGVVMYALKDGSILLKGPKSLWNNYIVEDSE
jgi:hypothetical protein